jgi:hypothetical protein
MKHRFALHSGASLLLAALVAASPCRAASPTQGGPDVGKWKTWNLASPDEITVPAPPADTSDQTKAELNELRLLQTLRSPILNTVADNWNGLNATKRWTDAAARLPLHPVFAGRISAYMHTAMLDAVVVAYRAKYAYNRKAPTQLATDLTLSVASVPDEPSYPSEYAAIAGAASAVLDVLDPANAKTYDAMAQEEANSRMIAGTNYRSDVEAGLTLGRAVAAKAIARAQSDGSDAVSTEPLPTGPGIWVGTTIVGRLKGTWRPWLMTSGSQFRPGPPPAFGSPEFNAALAEVKRRATTVTASEKAISDFWLANSFYVVFFNTAYTLMAQENTSPARAARITAAIATTADDAVISVWDAKFHYWYIRPYQADPTIPLLVAPPPYPSYTSGFTGVITGLTEPIGYFFPQEAARLRLIAEQGGDMRIYQGIHYRFDVEPALQQGRQVAQLSAERDKANDQ